MTLEWGEIAEDIDFISKLVANIEILNAVAQRKNKKSVFPGHSLASIVKVIGEEKIEYEKKTTQVIHRAGNLINKNEMAYRKPCISIFPSQTFTIILH